MKATKHEQALIHVVMEMAYEQGIEEGRKQAVEEIKRMKEVAHKERMERDFSHHPSRNIYTSMEERND